MIGLCTLLPSVIHGAPALRSASPSSGQAAGGTSVALHGLGFLTATGVLVDGTSVPFTIDNDGQITCTTVDHALGAVDVVVQRPTGNLTLAGGFTFVKSFPLTCTSCTPNHGNSGGTTAVALHGTGFHGVTSIELEPYIAGVAFAVVDDTQITLTIDGVSLGASPSDVVSFRVIRTTSIDEVMGASEFTFDAAAGPSITSLNHTLGDTLGGESVVITGTLFSGGTAVHFGATPAASFVVDSATQITAVAPAHAAGSGDVTVTTPGGTSAPSAYEFWDPSVPTMPTIAYDRPDYALPAGLGTWSRRMGLNVGPFNASPGNQFIAQTAPTSPAISGAPEAGTPVFDHTASDRLVSGMSWDQLMAVNSATQGATLAIVIDITSIQSASATLYMGDGVMQDDNARGHLTLSRSTAPAVLRWYWYEGGYRAIEVALPAATGRVVALVRRSGAPGAVHWQLSVDGGATWTAANAGSLTAGTTAGTGNVRMGINTYDTYFDGRIRAAAFYTTDLSDPDCGKFKRWADARHP